MEVTATVATTRARAKQPNAMRLARREINKAAWQAAHEAIAPSRIITADALAKYADAIADAGARKTLELLEDTRKAIDAAHVFAIGVDRGRLLRDQATSITGTDAREQVVAALLDAAQHARRERNVTPAPQSLPPGEEDR